METIRTQSFRILGRGDPSVGIPETNEKLTMLFHNGFMLIDNDIEAICDGLKLAFETWDIDTVITEEDYQAYIHETIVEQRNIVSEQYKNLSEEKAHLSQDVKDLQREIKTLKHERDILRETFEEIDMDHVKAMP
jgi:hypothetical protein